MTEDQAIEIVAEISDLQGVNGECVGRHYPEECKARGLDPNDVTAAIGRRADKLRDRRFAEMIASHKSTSTGPTPKTPESETVKISKADALTILKDMGVTPPPTATADQLAKKITSYLEDDEKISTEWSSDRISELFDDICLKVKPGTPLEVTEGKATPAKKAGAKKPAAKAAVAAEPEAKAAPKKKPAKKAAATKPTPAKKGAAPKKKAAPVAKAEAPAAPKKKKVKKGTKKVAAAKAEAPKKKRAKTAKAAPADAPKKKAAKKSTGVGRGATGPRPRIMVWEKYPVTAIFRWFGANGYKATQAVAALAALGYATSEGTARVQCSNGAAGDDRGGPLPDLTGAEIKKLKAAAKEAAAE